MWDLKAKCLRDRSLNLGFCGGLNLGGEEPNPGRPSYMAGMGWYWKGGQDLPCQICDGGTQDASVSWQGLWCARVL